MTEIAVRIVDDRDLSADWLVFEDERHDLVGVALRRSALWCDTVNEQIAAAIVRLRRTHSRAA